MVSENISNGGKSKKKQKQKKKILALELYKIDNNNPLSCFQISLPIFVTLLMVLQKLAYIPVILDVSLFCSSVNLY